MDKVQQNIQIPKMRCPYCHDEIERGVEPVSCPSCHAAHHMECLREHGRCATCNAPHPRFHSAAGTTRPAVTRAEPRAARHPVTQTMIDLAPEFFAGFVGLVTLIATIADWGSDMALGVLMGLALWASIPLGFLIPERLAMKRRRVALQFLLFALAVIVFPLISTHGYHRHFAECVKGALMAFVPGVLGFLLGGTKEEPETLVKPQKGS